MRPSSLDLAGTGCGVAKRLAPATRLVLGTSVFVVGMVAPTDTLGGLALMATGSVGWFVACLPTRQTLRLLLFGVALLAPWPLLTLLLPHVVAQMTPQSAVAQSFELAMRGLVTMLVSVSTVSVLTLRDMGEGLGRLHVAADVSAIVVQILHQAGSLIDETRRISLAMVLRGVNSSRKLSFSVLWSLPRVWLPRVMDRADRVATAMTIRGYHGCSEGLMEPQPLRWMDMLGFSVAVVLIALSSALRWVSR